MMAKLRWACCALPLSLLACGGSEDGIAPEPERVTVNTPSFEVPAGESFTCTYTDVITSKELSAFTAAGHQQLGGHHAIVYYSTKHHEVGSHPCRDDEMQNFRMVAGTIGGRDDGDIFELHDDMAVRVPKDVQLVVESHYINTSGAPMQVQDRIEVLVKEPERVSSYVGSFATVDLNFEVPAQASATSETYCEVPEDLDVVMSMGHLHEDGTRYRLDVVDDDGEVLQNLHDDAWSPAYLSHPPLVRYPLADPLHLPKGTLLRQTCAWDNPHEEALSHPTEMCVGFFYYANDAGDLYCFTKPREDD